VQRVAQRGWDGEKLRGGEKDVGFGVELTWGKIGHGVVRFDGSEQGHVEVNRSGSDRAHARGRLAMAADK
jgi:hypothetical protein